MEALILSCGTGGGHNAAARAVAMALEAKGHRVTVMNPYTLAGEKTARIIDQTYIRIARNMPKLFGAIYGIGDLYRKLPVKSPVYYTNRKSAERMAGYLKAHPADIVLMPHLFPAEIFTQMKHHGLPVPKTVFIATDYVCTPFTEETECDAYIVPTPELQADFIRRGIPADKIYPLGIPVRPDFQAGEREDYLLLSGGSFGAGKLKKAVYLLSEHFGTEREIRVLCGGNRVLYEWICRRGLPGIVPLGPTDQVGELMGKAALYIGKPGGLSSTEAAVCQTPLLHISPIPGCESRNARYFQKRGMSIYARVTKRKLIPAVEALLTPEVQQKMALCQRQGLPADAARKIAVLAETLVEEKKDE